MNISGARPALAAALLLSGLCGPAAFAHAGGHGSSGGGGHSGGSSGHSSGGHAGGAHFAPQHFAPQHFAPQHFAPQHFATAPRATAFVGAGRAPMAYGGYGHGAAAARSLVGAGGYGGRAIGPGYGHDGHWGHWGGGHWGGGYWGGHYWPGVYYGAGFAWFLPVLPLYCATYWWNSVPYYYYNDVYYTWSPTADGYVATDPPPVAASAPPPATDSAYDAAAASAESPPADAAPAPEAMPEPIPPGAFASGRGPDNVYAYPSNGQSEQQQAADRVQCAQWAASQTGGAARSANYRRAEIACFQGRGYSAQ